MDICFLHIYIYIMAVKLDLNVIINLYLISAIVSKDSKLEQLTWKPAQEESDSSHFK